MKNVLLLFLNTLLSFSLIDSSRETTFPVVGVLTEPCPSTECESRRKRQDIPVESDVDQCFSSVYVKWLEQSGNRVLVVPYNAPKPTLDLMILGVSAVLFTGGDLTLGANTQYFRTAQYIYDKVLQQNSEKKRGHLTLWGTCQGFQLLNILTSGNHGLLTHFDSYGYSLPLNFTVPQATNSRMFGRAPKEVWSTLANKAVTANLHHLGVSPEDFYSTPSLTTFYDILSTNLDRNGKEFISTFEGKRVPVYGVQWHPERPQFEYKPEHNNTWFNHGLDSIIAMQYMGNFLREEASKSPNSFENSLQLQKVYKKYNIYNFAVEPNGNSYQCYHWPASFGYK